MAQLKSNLWKLPVITAFRWFMLILPVLIPFYQHHGLSMRQVLIVQAVYAIAIVVFEVPSGYMADRIGRKKSIILGVLFSFLGYGAYSLSYGFVGFLVAEIILALSSSFVSGADSALLYDSLKELDREPEYKKHQGRLSSVESFSEGTAAIVGGLIAVASFRYPLYINAALNFLALPIAFSLVEPLRQSEDKSDWSSKGIVDAVKYSLHGHPQIKWLILFSSVLGAGTLTAVFFYQKYFENVGLPLALFGVVWAALQFSVALFALYSHKIEGRLGRRGSLILMAVMLPLGYFLLGAWQSLWGILFMLVFYFVRGFNSPVLKDYVNQLAPSEIRATILSVKALATRLLFSVTGPLAGYFHDAYSFKTAFFLAGGTFFALGVVSLLFLKKHKAL